MPQLQASITLRSPSTRTAVGAALNERIADVTQVMGMVQTAHWNVRGEHSFKPVHRMFGNLVCTLWKSQEQLAGRARALGFHVTALTTPPSTARIPAYPADITSVSDHLREVSIRLAVLIGLLRQTRDLAEDREEDQTEETMTDILIRLEKKGRRLLNSMPDADATSAMNAAQTALGGSQNAAPPTGPKAAPPAR